MKSRNNEKEEREFDIQKALPQYSKICYRMIQGGTSKSILNLNSDDIFIYLECKEKQCTFSSLKHTCPRSCFAGISCMVDLMLKVGLPHDTKYHGDRADSPDKQSFIPGHHVSANCQN